MRYLLKPWILIPILVLVGLVLGIWIFLPWWAIRYVQKHDREWINRDITIERLALNPFTATATIRAVQISEVNTSVTFARFDRLRVNLAPWPLLRNRIHVQELVLDSLNGRIVQNGNRFNFSDLLERGAKESEQTKPDTASASQWTYELHAVQLNGATLSYEDQVIGSHLSFDSITIRVDSFTSEDDRIASAFSLHQREGGQLEGEAVYQLDDGDYQAKVKLDSIRLYPFTPYVTKGIRLSYFDGIFEADVRLSGNANQTNYIATAGQFDLLGFRMADPDQDTLVSLGQVHIGIDTMDTRAELFDFQNVLLKDTYTKFEYLPNGDNFSKLLVLGPASDSLSARDTSGSGEQKIEINASNYYASPFEYLALYVYDLTRDYIFKSYTADSVAVHNFNLKFYDYTLEDPFYMDVSEMTIFAGEIAREDPFADFAFQGVLNRTGILGGDVLVSREGAENMEVNFEIKGLFLNGLSPYSRYYTAHPFLEGAVTFTSQNQIEDYFLKSSNRLFIEQVRVGKKEKTRSGYSLPMKLAVVLLRDLNGNIDLEVPIEGPLNDPDYRIGKVIWQVIKNIFTKAATAPFRLLANAFKVNEDDLKNIYFDNGQDYLGKEQYKALDAVAKVLNKKEELGIEMLHLYNREYELDALALLKAKKNYLLTSGEEIPDSLMWERVADIPNTDSLFLDYLRNLEPYDSTISVPENVRRYLGEEKLERELTEIIEKQKDLVQTYLEEEKGIAPTRYRIKDLSAEEESINQTRPRFTVQFQVEEEMANPEAGSEDPAVGER